MSCKNWGKETNQSMNVEIYGKEFLLQNENTGYINRK